MSKVDDFEMNQEVFGQGLLQILGRAPMPEPEVAGPPCEHTSDGFIYNLEEGKPAPVMLLLMCTQCHEQYEIPNNGYTNEIPQGAGNNG